MAPARSLTRTLARAQPWTLLLVRLAVGTAMIYHGFEKLIPPGGLRRAAPLAGFTHFSAFVVTLGLPPWLAYASVLTEFLGGILLFLGLFTRPVAVLIAINMAVALVTVDLQHGYPASQYTLLLIAAALLLVTTGSGALSLDRHFGFS